MERAKRLLRVFGAGMVFVLVVLLFRQVAGDVLGTNDPARVSAFAYDFSAYYDAANRLITTGTPYQPDQTLSGPFLAGPKGLYLYSPLPAIVVLPLTALSFHDAATIYVALQLLVVLAICLLMPVSWTVRLAILAVACLAPPVDQDLNLGNISLLMTLAGVVAWRWMDKPIGAVAVMISAALRPTMALIGAWWAIRGRWRLIGWMVVSGLVLVLLSLPFVGIQGWLDYLTVLRNATHFEEVYRNWALNAIAYGDGLPDPWPTLALVASFAIAIGAMLFSLRRDRELSYIVTFTATLIASPSLVGSLHDPHARCRPRSWPAAAAGTPSCCRCCASCPSSGCRSSPSSVYWCLSWRLIGASRQAPFLIAGRRTAAAPPPQCRLPLPGQAERRHCPRSGRI